MTHSLRRSGLIRLAAMAALFLTTALLLGAVEASAKTVQMHNLKTSTVIVGDSRVVGLWKSGYQAYSLTGSCGGRFSNNDNRTIHSKKYGKTQKTKVAYSKSRYKCIRNSIVSALKKHRKCRVIIFSTINEADTYYGRTVEDMDDAAQKLVNFAKKCRIRVKVKGKYYRAKVYVVQCPRAAEFGLGERFPIETVNAYNELIVKYKKGTGVRYVKLPREPLDEEFREDGLHFVLGKSGYNAVLWRLARRQKF